MFDYYEPTWNEISWRQAELWFHKARLSQSDQDWVEFLIAFLDALNQE